MGKQFFALFVTLFVFATAIASQPTQQPHKKIALVLSGGGAKGMAHIGALKVIEQAGIPIDYVVGTSMGSIIGGLYAIGYTPAQLDSMVRVQDWTTLLTDRIQRRDRNILERERAEKYLISYPIGKNKGQADVAGGFIKGENLSDLFNELTSGYNDSIDFNRLPIPFACVAYDITNGNETVYHSGILAKCMRASMAIPGVFTPVRDGDKVLVDGGVINNFPVDVAREMGADIVIGIDVQSKLRTADDLSGTLSVLLQLVDLTGNEKFRKNLDNTDTYVKVDVEGYSASSFNAADIIALIERGEKAANEYLPALLQAKAQAGYIDSKLPPRKPFQKESLLGIRHISFKGIESDDANWIINRCNLHDNTLMTLEQIKAVNTLIRANTSYEGAFYQLSAADNGRHDLTYTLVKKNEDRIDLGIHFDTDEFISLAAQATFGLKTKLPQKFIIDGRMGLRMHIGTTYKIESSPLSSFDIGYQFSYNDFDVFDHSKKWFNTTHRKHTVRTAYNNVWIRNFRFTIGGMFEFYDFKKFLFDSESVPEWFNTDHDKHFTYFATLNYDTYDRAYYPRNGVNFSAAYHVYTDDLFHYKGHEPITAVSGRFEGVIPITHRFSLVPAAYTRILFGSDIPFTLRNLIGGDMNGRYVEQQMPFIGFVHPETCDNSLVIASLKARQRMGDSHYLILGGNYAFASDMPKDLLQEERIYGGCIGYGFDSIGGPLEISFNYIGGRSNEVSTYVNLGFKF
ncbi:MAG: patatin-like phospholipase family protein [Bacteroidales bacterium]|nr:patatin-like phospholipase family protein [Bacteroidales bacterium]